ncbi:uncharacterized protein IUM83_12041 [Phytophthora cinnamomi]|uniref:uncharacterized protein n=1 Tax=Phytophthora cinnamomi TaxID=4785 RepID=UPI00355A0D23|nr:hypothetical protein IUM83_12041 [Phytophthora cinnamomi]
MAEDELLARARRLCLAARQLQLPVLLPGVGRSAAERQDEQEALAADDSSRELEASSSGSQSADKLPLIPTTASAVSKHRKQAKLSDDRGKRQLEDARRLEEETKRHERELERVKQAQERARARVARTNQLEQQSLRTAEQQQSDALSTADECAEKIRRAQESRRRAKERIRIKLREKTPDSAPPSSAPGFEAEPVKLKAFHRKTIRRLHSSNQRVHQIDRGERQSTPERSEDIDLDQKLMERKLRQETAARLRRMRQQAEHQKRQEQEEFEQGLQKYKSKLREMDRTAKGLSKLPSLPQINEPLQISSIEAKEAREKTPPTPCYSYKAILPVPQTAPGYSVVSTLGPATRLRAQEISRQIK